MIVSLLYKIKPLTRHNENKLACTQTIHTKKKRLKVLYLIYNLCLFIYLYYFVSLCFTKHEELVTFFRRWGYDMPTFVVLT